MPFIPVAQVSSYSSLTQNDGEGHPPLASTEQGCPQLHNSIYSSHLFAALGSEIQVEESQSHLINDPVLTPAQEGSNLVTRTCEKKQVPKLPLQRTGQLSRP